MPGSPINSDSDSDFGSNDEDEFPIWHEKTKKKVPLAIQRLRSHNKDPSGQDDNMRATQQYHVRVDVFVWEDVQSV